MSIEHEPCTYVIKRRGGLGSAGRVHAYHSFLADHLVSLTSESRIVMEKGDNGETVWPVYAWKTDINNDEFRQTGDTAILNNEL